MKAKSKAISTIMAIVTVVVIIVISGISTYFVMNNGNTRISSTSSTTTTNYTVSASCSTNASGVCPTQSSMSSKTTSYSTATNTVPSLLTGGGCSFSSATAYTTAPVKVLSIGVSCSNYDATINGTMETVRLLNFNVTLENLSNGDMTAQVGFNPTLSFLGISFGSNSGLLRQLDMPLCTVTTAASTVGQHGIATASFPSCFDETWYYVTGNGSIIISLNPALYTSNYSVVASVKLH